MPIVRRVRRALARKEYPVVPAHLGRLDYEGAPIVIGVTTRAEILSRMNPVAKEPWTVGWIEQSLRPGDTFWDIGANVGAYSLIAAAAGGPDVRVVAVEPGYANYAALCDNVRLNERGQSIVALPVALGSRTGLETLGYSDVAAGAAEHTFAAGAGQQVLAYRLDDLVEAFGLAPPTLLKLDVDGAEGEVLAGAERTLARPELRSVLVEVERDRTDAVVPLLEGAGLALRERIDERDGVPFARVWYGIYERR